MKKHVLLAVACLATMTTGAQNIAVVNSNNKTTVYQMLDSALVHAEDGDVIYLPGGGFKVNDATKITKRVTIMGVSHRGDTDNSDGATIIAGNLYFNEGSDGSAVIGCYITGNIYIGEDEGVNNMLIRYCNLNAIIVKDKDCSGIAMNQCYARSLCDFSKTNGNVTNSVVFSIVQLDGGRIDHNVIVRSDGTYPIYSVNNSDIFNNIVLANYFPYKGNDCQIYNNMIKGMTFGENCITIDDWAAVIDSVGTDVKPTYSYKLISDKGKNAGLDGTDVGIYGGTGFKDKALAPIPRIVSKKVDEQTSADGTLTVTVTVKAQ